MTPKPESALAALEEVEDALGLGFRDRRLLLAALTHRSYLNEVADSTVGDNERLEFLGDAVVDFVVGDYLYRQLPEAPEGELTALRARLVCATALAEFARALQLGSYLRLGRGEDASGGRRRPTNLGNAFEALVGAVYLDQGMATAAALVRRFLPAALAAILEERALKDAKSRLQELSQRRWQLTPRYETVDAQGPDHAKTFVVRVHLGEQVWGEGTGASKAAAAQAAAARALEHLESETASDEAAARVLP